MNYFKFETGFKRYFILIKVSITCIILFSYINAKATVFTVITNSDTGIGSLRDALAKAKDNGNLEKDFVYFNIAGNNISDYTIKLISILPEINSDIVIDASTQPSSVVSSNGAKIIIDGSQFIYTDFGINSIFRINSVLNV